MPLFFFDYFDGREISEDEDGTELPDMQAARDEAVRLLLDLGRDILPIDGEARALDIRVRGADGAHLLTVSVRYSEEPPDWIR